MRLAELSKPRAERQGEQEAEQDLYPKSGDAQFPQQLSEIAVIALFAGLIAPVPRDGRLIRVTHGGPLQAAAILCRHARLHDAAIGADQRAAPPVRDIGVLAQAGRVPGRGHHAKVPASLWAKLGAATRRDVWLTQRG